MIRLMLFPEVALAVEENARGVDTSPDRHTIPLILLLGVNAIAQYT